MQRALGWHHRISNGPWELSSALIGQERNAAGHCPLRGRHRTVCFWEALGGKLLFSVAAKGKVWLVCSRPHLCRSRQEERAFIVDIVRRCRRGSYLSQLSGSLPHNVRERAIALLYFNGSKRSRTISRVLLTRSISDRVVPCATSVSHARRAVSAFR
jgi:hypothetical protein